MYLLFQDSNKRKIHNERTGYFASMESQQLKQWTFLKPGCLMLEN